MITIVKKKNIDSVVSMINQKINSSKKKEIIQHHDWLKSPNSETKLYAELDFNFYPRDTLKMAIAIKNDKHGICIEYDDYYSLTEEMREQYQYIHHKDIVIEHENHIDIINYGYNDFYNFEGELLVWRLEFK